MYEKVRVPLRISSSGGILSSPGSKSNIADTQTAVFQFSGLNCVWQHRTWGEAVDPQYPWGYKIYGDKGTFPAVPINTILCRLEKEKKFIWREMSPLRSLRRRDVIFISDVPIECPAAK